MVQSHQGLRIRGARSRTRRYLRPCRDPASLRPGRSAARRDGARCDSPMVPRAWWSRKSDRATDLAPRRRTYDRGDETFSRIWRRLLMLAVAGCAGARRRSDANGRPLQNPDHRHHQSGEHRFMGRDRRRGARAAARPDVPRRRWPMTAACCSNFPMWPSGASGCATRPVRWTSSISTPGPDRLDRQSHATPFSEAPIPSNGAANGVLELRAGRADEIGAKAGDTVIHPFFVRRLIARCGGAGSRGKRRLRRSGV